MRPLLISVAALLMVLACACPPSNIELRTSSLTDIVAQVAPLTVMVHAESVYGSGVLIRHGNHVCVLTCYHVIAQYPFQKLKIELNDGTMYNAVYAFGDTKYDLAVLSVPDIPRDHCTIEFSYDELMIGEELLILGYPAGCGFSISSGVVSGVDKKVSAMSVYYTGLGMTDAPVNPGNSGGPVVDMTGRLIGIAQLSNMRYDGIGLFVSVPRIREFLDGARNRQPLLLDTMVH